jgi:2-amino-4-hydroxy-6-hydroxymethyldihydropteridine diphosphokinase
VPLDVVVGLGSNLGDRLGNLRAAVADLGEVYEVRARSTVYETAPVGPPQPDYLNAAVRLRALGDLEEVLHVLLVIERRHGRTRIAANRWGARTVDLDILWAGSVVVDTPSLTVPHPRLVERAFALRPLLDVAPDAVDPRTGALFVKPAVGGDVRETELAW